MSGKEHIRAKFPAHMPELTDVEGSKFDASSNTFLVEYDESACKARTENANATTRR